MGVWNWLWKSRDTHYAACYAGVVRRARDAVFYSKGGIPDTLDGRFDMLVLHLHLVLRRLRGADKQAVFDLFFKDMDHGLREAGVSDLRVGKQIRKMAEAFYGRAKAYDEALAKTGDARLKALAEIVTRNVFSDAPIDAERLNALARYIVVCEEALAGCERDALFADPFAGVSEFNV